MAASSRWTVIDWSNNCLLMINARFRGLLFGLRIFTLFYLCHLVSHAQQIKGSKNEIIDLPTRFLTNEKGIQFVPKGQPMQLIKWEQINLTDLSQKEPSIEDARQKALMHRVTTYFEPKKPWQELKAFMAAPVEIRFQRKVETRSTSTGRYNVSLTGFSTGTSSLGILAASGFIVGQSSTISVSIDRTRYPLATNMEGLFLTIGNDKHHDSYVLISDLQSQNAFFVNLLMGLRNLKVVYPRYGPINDAIKAVELLSNGQQSIDAQRELYKFAMTVRALN